MNEEVKGLLLAAKYSIPYTLSLKLFSVTGKMEQTSQTNKLCIYSFLWLDFSLKCCWTICFLLGFFFF